MQQRHRRLDLQQRDVLIMNTEIANLESEVQSKLEELRLLAVANDAEASVNIGGKHYWVFQAEGHEEEDLDYLREEMGVEVGDWVSSSDMC